MKNIIKELDELLNTAHAKDMSSLCISVEFLDQVLCNLNELNEACTSFYKENRKIKEIAENNNIDVYYLTALAEDFLSRMDSDASTIDISVSNNGKKVSIHKQIKDGVHNL